MFQPLTSDEIMSYRDSSEIKIHIDALLDKMKKQGLTMLFINPKMLYSLAKELEKEGALDSSDSVENYSVTNLDKAFAAHLEAKIFGMLSKRENISRENIVQMAGVICNVLFTPKNAHVLFSIIAEYVYPLKERFSKYLKKVEEMYDQDEQEALAGSSWGALADVWRRVDAKLEWFRDYYNKALPCGVNLGTEDTIWRFTCYQEFKQLDVSPLINTVDYERYYSVVFKHTPIYENVLYGELDDFNLLKVDLVNYRKKDDLKKDINQVFKLMVFDAMFKSFYDPEEFYETDHKEMVMSYKENKLMWVCFIYIAAMIYVSRSEYERITKLMQKKGEAPWESVTPI